MNIAGKRVLITGGSSGIGLSLGAPQNNVGALFGAVRRHRNVN
ncbi:hypothetical protein ACX3P1_21695 [Mesorhizobium sp. A623]